MEERMGEVLQAGAVVRHLVDWSWEVLGVVAVAVVALVVAGELAEVGGRAGGGHGLLAGSADGGCVVAHVLQGGVNHGVAVRHDVKLGQEGSLLQVAVGDVAREVVGGHEGVLHVLRERKAPVEALPGVVEVNAAHARTCGVSGAEQHGVLGNQLRQVSGACAEAGGEACEGIDVAADEGI